MHAACHPHRRTSLGSGRRKAGNGQSLGTLSVAFAANLCALPGRHRRTFPRLAVYRVQPADAVSTAGEPPATPDNGPSPDR